MNLCHRIKYVFARAGSAMLVLAYGFAPLIAQAEACPKGFLCNPLKTEFSSIPLFIAGSLKVLVMIALPVIVLFFVIAGFKFISAQGNPGKLDEARKNFVWVVAGALLIMGAWVLATLIAATVSQLVEPSQNQNLIPGPGQQSA